MVRRLFFLSLFAICCCKRPDHAKLFQGMGAIHHPISTTNAEAQKFFDQGLALVYAFNFSEAIRSFERAAELDPNAAMPYWGIALADGPNYNAWTVGTNQERAGFDAIQTAVGLEPRAPEREKRLIDALARCFTDEQKADQHKLLRDYSDAMRDVYHRYPDDPDVAALFSASLMNLNPWHLWTLDGQPGPETTEIVTVLEAALERWPEHTGINHFYIHTMEGSAHPERALPSAYRMGNLAPAAGHLVHMSSHIFLHTGDYAAAVLSNERAIEADKMAPPHAMGYAHHNQNFLAVAAGMDGEFETAWKAAKEIESEMHPEAMRVMSIEVPMRFARWDQVLALADPKSPGVEFFWHLARGCAFANKGRVKEAADEQAAMDDVFSHLPEGRAFGTFFNDWSMLHTLADDTLAARTASARGDADAAIGHWRHAVETEDKLNFDDLPDWYYPIRESLGAALLLNKRAAEAEQVFRADLARNPRNPRSLFGLAKALEAQQKVYEAGLVLQSFKDVWRGKELPRIEDL